MTKPASLSPHAPPTEAERLRLAGKILGGIPQALRWNG
jgi:hypothetical protein